jgi:hypothetical protein
MGQLSVTHACFRSKVNRTVAGSPANVTIITHMKHYEWRQRDPRGEAAMGNSHLCTKEPPDTRAGGIFPAHETDQHKDKKDYISDEGREDVDPAIVRM